MPKSVMVRLKVRAAALAIPYFAEGKVTLKKVFIAEAPRLCAASSRRVSTADSVV